MAFAPGQSGNPSGYQGPRNTRRKEVFKLIEGLGHKDALVILSTTANDETADLGLRVAAASYLAPYCHPKMQATPTPRFIDLQIDLPEFTHVSDAEAFLARIALLCAKGHLDIQSAQELSGLVKLWIDSQYQREELQFKINPPEERDVTITVTGGLGGLPGTNIAPTQYGALSPPVLNGHAVNEQLLTAPTDVVPPEPQGNNDLHPADLKAQGPHPLQEHHFAAGSQELRSPGQNPATGNGKGSP